MQRVFFLLVFRFVLLHSITGTCNFSLKLFYSFTLDLGVFIPQLMEQLKLISYVFTTRVCPTCTVGRWLTINSEFCLCGLQQAIEGIKNYASIIGKHIRRPRVPCKTALSHLPALQYFTISYMVAIATILLVVARAFY